MYFIMFFFDKNKIIANFISAKVTFISMKFVNLKNLNYTQKIKNKKDSKASIYPLPA